MPGGGVRCSTGIGSPIIPVVMSLTNVNYEAEPHSTYVPVLV